MIDMARIMVNTSTVNLEENGRKKNNNPIQGEWLPKTAMPIAESDNFTIFPNPTNGTFEMRLSTAVYNIEVRNMLGQTVFNMVGNGTDRIDATTWQSGVYLLTAKNQMTGKIYSTKVVKE